MVKRNPMLMLLRISVSQLYKENRFNPLALEMDIQIVAHHLCKM